MFSWLGGISLGDDNLEHPAREKDSRESVDELWNKLFRYEQSLCCVCYETALVGITVDTYNYFSMIRVTEMRYSTLNVHGIFTK